MASLLGASEHATATEGGVVRAAAYLDIILLQRALCLWQLRRHSERESLNGKADEET